MTKTTNTHSDKVDESIKLAKETCRGDVRDFLVHRLQNWKKPWNAFTESEQREHVAQANEAAEALIERVAEIMAAEGRKAIVGTLESVMVKDGIKGVIKMSKKDPQRHELTDAVGMAVIVVVKGIEELQGEAAPAEVQKDQKDLVDTIKEQWSEDDKAEGKDIEDELDEDAA